METPVARNNSATTLPSGNDILARIEGRSVDTRKWPWDSRSPGEAIDRAMHALRPYENWVILAAAPRATLANQYGVADPAQRPDTLTFAAYTRPGACIALIIDPFEIRDQNNTRSATLVSWSTLNPHQRHPLLRAAFRNALLAPTPMSLLARVAQASRSNAPMTYAWGYNLRILRAGVETTLGPEDRDALNSMDALGAFT